MNMIFSNSYRLDFDGKVKGIIRNMTNLVY